MDEAKTELRVETEISPPKPSEPDEKANQNDETDEVDVENDHEMPEVGREENAEVAKVKVEHAEDDENAEEVSNGLISKGTGRLADEPHFRVKGYKGQPPHFSQTPTNKLALLT